MGKGFNEMPLFFLLLGFLDDLAFLDDLDDLDDPYATNKQLFFV